MTTFPFISLIDGALEPTIGGTEGGLGAGTRE